jgi:hypothetical protein
MDIMAMRRTALTSILIYRRKLDASSLKVSSMRRIGMV